MRNALQLRRPPFPKIDATALYYCTQAGHRKYAIELVIKMIRAAEAKEKGPTGDVFGDEMVVIMSNWAVESLLQGAWMREYHMWELDTKEYFSAQHMRSKSTPPNWKPGKGQSPSSHVEKVKAQIFMFGANVSAETLEAIDAARMNVNLAKHETEHYVKEEEYFRLTDAVAAFWEELIEQELFTPPEMR